MSDKTGPQPEEERVISEKKTAQDNRGEKMPFEALNPESKKILRNIFGSDLNENSPVTSEVKQKALLFRSILNKIKKGGNKPKSEITNIAKESFSKAEEIYTDNLKVYSAEIKLLESNWRTLQMYQERRVGAENKNLNNLTIINADLNKLSKLEGTAIIEIAEKIKEIYKSKNTVVSKEEKLSYILLPAQNLTVDTYKKYQDFYELILEEVSEQSEHADVKPKDDRFINYNSNGCLVVVDLPGIETTSADKQIDYINRLRTSVGKMDRAKDAYKFAVIYFNQAIFKQVDWNQADSWLKSSINKELSVSGSAFALSFAVAHDYDYFQSETGYFTTKDKGNLSLKSPVLKYSLSLHDQNRKGLRDLNISVLNSFKEEDQPYVESAKIGYYKNVEPGEESLNLPLSSANASMMITKTLNHLQNETLKGNKGFNDEKFRDDLQRTLNKYLRTLTQKGILSNKSENICTKVGRPENGNAPILLQYKIASLAEEIDLKIDTPELKVKV